MVSSQEKVVTIKTVKKHTGSNYWWWFVIVVVGLLIIAIVLTVSKAKDLKAVKRKYPMDEPEERTISDGSEE
jgi:nitric oxide reductase large subunit